MKTGNKVYIVGTGPGREDYLIPAAKIEIERADCLIGARRVLSQFEHLQKENVYLGHELDKAVSFIKENKNKKRIAVLVTGDPGLYSFLDYISKELKKNEYTVIPGISALQLASARLGETWQDAKIISLHARQVDDLIEQIRGSSKVFLLTDDKFAPDKIAAYLADKGLDNRRVVVLERLSYPDEKIVDTDLKTLAQTGDQKFGLCVMMIKKEEGGKG